MTHQNSNNEKANKIDFKLIAYLFFAAIIVVLVFIFGWKITSLNFFGIGLEPPETEIASSLGIYDTFDNKVYDGKWNDSTWAEFGSVSQIQQRDGVLMLSREVDSFGGVVAYQKKWRLSQIDYVESKIMLSSNIQTQDGDIGIEINTLINGNWWFTKCAIHGEKGNNIALILCDTADGVSIPPIEVSYDSWHVVRIDVDSEKPTIAYYVDGQKAGEYMPQDTNGFKFAEYSLMLNGWASNGGFISGSFDYVQLKTK